MAYEYLFEDVDSATSDDEVLALIRRHEQVGWEHFSTTPSYGVYSQQTWQRPLVCGRFLWFRREKARRPDDAG